MLWLFLALFVVVQEPARPARDVQARVPASYVGVSVRLDRYGDDDELWRQAAADLGKKAVLFGHFGSGDRLTVSIIAESISYDDESAPLTSAQWRERLSGGEGEPFQVGAIACREGVISIGGLRQVDFNAFPVAAGYCFDLHVSLLTAEDEGSFGRDEFVRIVESFRVAFLRRGWREDYPPHVLDVMHAAAVRAPSGGAWLEAESERRPADYALPFVQGELLKVQRAPAAVIVSAYERALPLFEAIESPTPQQIFAWAVAEDGLGIALADSGRLEEARRHYRHGYELANGIHHRVRAALSYNLACASALSGESREALEFLRLAIEVEERYRALGRQDSDFASLREDAAFLALVAAEDDE